MLTRYDNVRPALCIVRLLFGMVALSVARPLLAAPQIAQINPGAASPGQTLSLTVSGADPVAANNLVNFLQNGANVGQAARVAAPPRNRRRDRWVIGSGTPARQLRQLCTMSCAESPVGTAVCRCPRRSYQAMPGVQPLFLSSAFGSFISRISRSACGLFAAR